MTGRISTTRKLPMKTTNRFRLAVGSAALAISMLALSGCGGGSAEGSATGGDSQSDEDNASENWDSRLSISAVNGDSTENACANLLGTPAEFAQKFGIDPENLVESGDSWEQKVSRWSSEERREKTATFICDVHYGTPGYTGGDSNGNAATYTLRFLAGSGEGARASSKVVAEGMNRNGASC